MRFYWVHVWNAQSVANALDVLNLAALFLKDNISILDGYPVDSSLRIPTSRRRSRSHQIEDTYSAVARLKRVQVLILCRYHCGWFRAPWYYPQKGLGGTAGLAEMGIGLERTWPQEYAAIQL
ncbi:hypothetical protein D9758_018581 [Tetrapyrgos nigripes]|uniref:Uncharacterized protein n=1 Tax=Tetrapyrgos nigripes TaxID=182062 RepID=A0A8H5F8X3_9AGAR|nr:hypothetical protein D9758_018581 [Tetrapyrgos nigripes]